MIEEQARKAAESKRGRRRVSAVASVSMLDLWVVLKLCALVCVQHKHDRKPHAPARPKEDKPDEDGSSEKLALEKSEKYGGVRTSRTLRRRLAGKLEVLK